MNPAHSQYTQYGAREYLNGTRKTLSKSGVDQKTAPAIIDILSGRLRLIDLLTQIPPAQWCGAGQVAALQTADTRSSERASFLLSKE